MRTRRSITAVFTTAMALGVIAAGVTAAAAPNTYHDLTHPGGTLARSVAVNSATTPGAAPDTYHDL
jgi:hypothetical protein